MARKMTSPYHAKVTDLVNALRLPDTRNFTRALRELERAYGTYPRFNSEDAERIFQACKKIILHSNDPVLRYNALRLLKYVVTTDDFLRAGAEDVWTLYKETIFDADGNVRNAGVQLLSRLRFGITMLAEPFSWKRKSRSKKKVEERHRFQKMFVEQCIELFAIEKKYRDKHSDLDEVQEEMEYGLFRGSWDTKDKFLKTIRCGMEEVTRYANVPELAKKHGYELPRHWLFDDDMSEEIDMQRLVGDDMAGAMLHPEKSEPVLVSDPPDPKSFSSFEEYKNALDLRETFLGHVQTIDQVLSSGKSEEEIDKAMQALGFQKHDDAPCHRQWCIEQYGCIAMSLAHMLRDIEQSFLAEPVTPDQRLLSDHEIEECEQRYCHALPREWFVQGSRSHMAFRWFMDLMSALEWNKWKVPFPSLANDPLISAFVRESYWFTLSVLRERPWLQEREGSVLIKKFLGDNDLLSAEDASHLRKTFVSLQSWLFSDRVLV